MDIRTGVPATPSHVRGRTDAPLECTTVGDLFDRVARAHPGREAVVAPAHGVRWTYDELRKRVDRLAVALLRLGLEPGDRVGILAQNCPEWLLVQYATAKCGLVLVTINPAYRAGELEYALNAVGCRALFLTPRFRSSDYVAMLGEIVPDLGAAAGREICSDRAPMLRHVICLGEHSTAALHPIAELMSAPSATDLAHLQRVAADLSPFDPINIQFTSGTTGAPKGATLTHVGIVNNARFTADALRFTAEDRLCITTPLYHCFGMVLASLLCVCRGATMVLPCEAFDAEAVLRSLGAERCTAFHGVPTMFIGLLEHPSFPGAELSSLRTGIMGGAPCPMEVMKRVIEDMGMREITIAFGMTETSPVSFQSHVDDEITRRVTTVGRVHPHLEAMIVDGTGNVVPRGVAGEVLVRGYAVMQGYWGDPARTAEAVDAAGWMHTGDLGVLDAEGYLQIVGRAKDIVIRGGENIAPREIEEFLFLNPKVEQVAVFGVPDARLGEDLCAWIRLKAGASADEEEIRAFCKGRIAHFKIPRYFRFVDEFPMTVTGKLQKFVMKERMSRELAIRDGGRS